MAGRGRGRGGGGMHYKPAREEIKVFGNGRFPPPNPQVVQLENEMVKPGLSSAMAASSLDFTLPTRPAYGQSGRAIVLHANYFELKAAKKDMHLYRYSLSFLEEEELRTKKAKKKRLIEILLDMAPFSTLNFASDCNQKLVSAEKISLPEEGLKQTVTWYPKDGEPFPPLAADEESWIIESRTRHTYQIRIQALGSVSLADILRDVSQPKFNYALKLETIDALNTIITHGPGTESSVTTAARNKFFPFGSHPQAESHALGHGLQAHRGYFTNVRTSVGRLLVNVNVATGAFYKPGPLLNLMKEVCGGHMPSNEKAHSRMANFFRNVRIETNYIPDDASKNKENKGTKRKVHTIVVASYAKDSTNVTFARTDANGRITYPTVQQYFLQEYNIKLMAPEAPVVDFGGPNEPKWLPSELCKVIPGQLARRILLPTQTSAMITFAARRPYANAESITGNGLIVAKINPVVNGENTNLKAFGIKVDPNMITVPGRILNPPTVLYRGLKTLNPNNGAWNLKIEALGKSPFRVSRKLGEWSTLVINSGRFETIPGGFDGLRFDLERFARTLGDYGLDPSPPTKPCIVSIAPGLLEDAKTIPEEVNTIRSTIAEALMKQLSGKPKFLLVLLPNENIVLYDVLKSLFDLTHGIPSVCCVGSKFTKKSEQYYANVAMKFNQKLGGVNHVVDVKKMAPLDARTIIFGIDVTHPSPGSSETAPSIAGVVASVDGMFSQYAASMRRQEGRREMVTDLEEMIVERLRLWQRRNQNQLPNKVIVYRDGVGESQYQTVVEVEGDSFKNAFGRLYGARANHPKMSIIMVGKRHHTRFYPTKLEDTDGLTGNPKPGTVIDRGVGGEKLFDFFLLAHQGNVAIANTGLQGTSRPAHYVVLQDENKFGADQLQNLTHNLCYTFARATRSVSICPPAYYADILCERGRSYLHSVLKSTEAVALPINAWSRDVHPALMETMYYL